MLSGTSSYDFGVVELKGNPTVVRHTFHLTNDRKDQAALKIVKVNSSCGCTVGKPSKEAITAGDAVEVENIAATVRSGNEDGFRLARPSAR
ncbi:MAG: DUF1573 domain-containing protein [Planctomycetota bacterium]|nr:MAG: DUF1573 domain-containing protein [Planctomycetota bacterium]